MLRIDPDLQVTFKEHRSGWAYAMQAFRKLRSPDGVLFDGFVEHTHSWRLREFYRNHTVPYQEPWVGVIHNPPRFPSWCDLVHSPRRVLRREPMQESLKHCVGLFTLSAYLADWLRPRVSCPVSPLTHPTEIPDLKFAYRRWVNNQHKQIVAVGYWLRRLHSIQELDTKYSKAWLVPSDTALFMRDRESRFIETFGLPIGDYRDIPWVENAAYDEILSQNIVFLDLYDASACNAVIECAVRHTPVLVNPLPAVVEYLGHEYPFYYRTLREASEKAGETMLLCRPPTDTSWPWTRPSIP
jgi:hypothetical protein